MARILVSGLVNIETTVRVRQFPLPYYPVDYPFFGVRSGVAGVAFNVAKALKTLGDEPMLRAFAANDAEGARIRAELKSLDLPDSGLSGDISETPASVVLYDSEGRRQIHCDLKDVQERSFPIGTDSLRDISLAVACNINFNRPLLRTARERGIPIATDVHVLSSPDDAYNREFLENADIVFLSDEGISGDHAAFIRCLAQRFPAKIIVLGEGGSGASLFDRNTGDIVRLNAARTDRVSSTVGAGDALFSAFIHFWLSGIRPVEALRLAETFAAAKIAASGASAGFISEAETLRRHAAAPADFRS